MESVAAENDGSTFFDSLSREWVRIDNFAFSEVSNHFETSPLADSSFSILESQVIDENRLTADVAPGDEEEVERDLKEAAARMSKEKEDDAVQQQDVAALVNHAEQRDNCQKPHSRSSIPRYVRHTASSSSQSPVTRKFRLSDNNKMPVKNLCLKQRSRSASNLSLSRMSFLHGSCSKISGGSCSKSEEGDLNRMIANGDLPRVRKYSHVQSKVKSYIRDVKSAKDSRLRKSLSLSDLLREPTSSSWPPKISASGSVANVSSQNNLSKVKSFLQAEDVKITVSKKGLSTTLGSLDRFDRTRISRLLDDLSSEDERVAQEVKGGGKDEDEETTFEVEEVLALAIQERRQKKEAERVLSQLQQNYDQLQRRFAEAENKIDMLRFGRGSNNGSYIDGYECSTRTDISYPGFVNNISALLCDVQFPNAKKSGQDEEAKRSSSTPKKSNKEALQTIEDQLQSDSISQRDRKTSMEHLKRDISHLKQHALLYDGMSEDVDFMTLLKSIGKKLDDLELREKMARESPPETSQKSRNGQIINQSVIDPIEKVAKWRETQDSAKADPSSCYRNFTASMSSPPGEDARKTSGLKLRQHQQPQSPPAEFDSGYPGSDRSVKYYSLKGTSPAVSAKSNGGWRTPPAKAVTATAKQGRFLFNLEEEDKAPAVNYKSDDGSFSSSLPSDFQPQVSSERRCDAPPQPPLPTKDPAALLLKPPSSLHRTYLHSVTDLSSDERSMFGERSTLTVLPDNYRKTASVLERHLGPVATSEQQLPSSALSTGRQPLTLAKAIDKEIIELRNFYEDHREEMLSLLNDYSKEATPAPAASPPGKVNPRMSQASTDSGTDLGDLEHERRKEFEKRRRKKRLVSRDRSSNTVAEDSVHLPNFALGPSEPPLMSSGIAASSPRLLQPAKISSFFPYLSGGDGKDETDGGGGGNYREVATDSGPIFVPMLNLEDMWTDEDKVRDPRSFDFNPSLISGQFQSDEQGGAKGDGVSSTAPSKEVVVSEAMLDPDQKDRLGTPSLARQSREPVLLLQTCCLHSRCGEAEGDACRVYSAKLASKPPAKPPRVGTVKERKKSRAKEDMKNLLAALEQASAIASSLRERSQVIVKVLGQEIIREEAELQY